MLLAYSIIVILFCAVLFWVIVAGGRAAKAKVCLTRAVIHARARNFPEARRFLSAAVRITPDLAHIQQVKALDEIVVAEKADLESATALHRIETGFTKLPKTNTESIFLSPAFKLFVGSIIVISVLIRLLDILLK